MKVWKKRKNNKTKNYLHKEPKKHKIKTLKKMVKRNRKCKKLTNAM